MSTSSKSHVHDVIVLCQEVERLAKIVLEDFKVDAELAEKRKSRATSENPYPHVWDDRLSGAGARKAALKRRSMDLTRTLAQLRKP